MSEYLDKAFCNVESYSKLEKDKSIIPFKSFEITNNRNFIIVYSFNVPKKDEIGERKYKIMESIWYYLYSGGELSRELIYNNLRAKKLDVAPFEMNEFGKYINRIIKEVDRKVGVEEDGGISIKTIYKKYN